MRGGTEKKLFTVDELFRMEEVGLFQDEQVELVKGEIFLMPDGSRHQSRIDRLTALMVPMFGAAATIRVQGHLLLDKYNAPKPDLMLLKKRSDFYETRHPAAADVLLLVEISDSSIERDRDVKLAMYAIAGVQEYWIEDIGEETLRVYRNPANDGYETCLSFKRGQTLTPLSFPEIHVSVDEILGTRP